MRSFLLGLGFVAIPLASACSAFTGVDPTGLVASGDAGSDSGDGRTTRDSGTSRDSGSKGSDSGGTTSLGPDCTALQSCCDFLDTTSAASCRTTALDKNESSCSANLSAYQADGFCNDVTPPPPPVDSGTVTPPPPVLDSGLPFTANCSSLLGCCSATADTSCVTTALGGDDSACQTLYFTYILDGVACTTTP